MSARTVTITRDGSLIVIKGYKVAELARQGGLKPTYSGSVGGWALDAKRLPDLIGFLEYRNVRYELKGDIRPARTAMAREPANVPDVPQDSLW